MNHPSDGLVRLIDVARSFGADPPIHALRDVTLDIADGDWVSIVGPSGSGKSTLLNILGLLDRPTSGRYLLGGKDTSSLGERERAGARATQIGMVFQSFHLLPQRSALENVMLADVYRMGRWRNRRARAFEALARVDMTHRAEHLPTRLSGGERQRVAIARAVLTNPRLLLCDEPTGNLDVDSGRAILDLLAEVHDAGFTLVVITHDERVADAARRQVSLVDGRVDDIR